MDQAPTPKQTNAFGWILSFFKSHLHLSLILIAFVYAAVILMLTSIATSPLFPAGYAYSSACTDPNFFLYAGKLMYQGKTPYLEFYDHKGLYVFMMNALGFSLGIGKYGVFLLEVLVCTIAFTLLFEAIIELGYGYRGILTGMLVLSWGFLITYSGNHTGEWLLPFCSLILFFAAKAITRKEEKYWFFAVFCGGLQAGMAFNSRPSDAMWGLAICLAYFLHFLRLEKKGLCLLYAILLALAGFALPFLVTVPMAISGGYLREMFDAAILQSLTYLGDHPHPFRWIYYMIVIIWIVLAGLASVYRYKHKADVDLQLVLLSNLIVGGGVNLIIARHFNYFISSYPAVVLEVVSFLYLCHNQKISFRKGMPRRIVDSSIATLCTVYTVLFFACYYTVGWDDSGAKREAAIESFISSVVPEEDMKRVDGVYCLDTNASVYLNHDISVSAKIYTMQTWWALDNPSISKQVIDYLDAEKPTWIIQGVIGAGELDKAVNEKGYKVIDYLQSHYGYVDSQGEGTAKITIWKILP